MFSVDADSREAREIHFRPQLFNYNNAKVDTQQLAGKTDLGFAGFRAFKKPELAHAISSLSSAPAISTPWTPPITTASPRAAWRSTPEEFSDFTAFWFETPKAEDTTFVVYALLDGASITGAYKFTIHCEANRVVMEMQNHLSG